ncbi:MAG TPA: VOC family protein [Methylomirabilota bacterium]|nr:VOC family protein [Methylomirabilota bacterium]
MEIAPDAHMGLVELSVSDLDRSLAYWQDAVGLRELSRENGTAELGTDTPLVRFVEEPGARPAAGFTGLFHVALLVPDRPSLGRFLAHTVRDQIPLTGLSDHRVSEAIYLRDPDYHGIEVYADRPREQWEGQVAQQMTTIPLDAGSLLAEAGEDGFDGLPDGTTVGHVHLCVRDVDETIGFYRDKLGMGLTAHLGDQAAFLSAGGYHHHIGGNTWETRGAPPAPEGTARLLRYTIVLPDEAERDRVAERIGGTEVRDPSGNPLVLATG